MFYLRILIHIIKIFLKGGFDLFFKRSTPESACYYNLIRSHSFRLAGITHSKFRNFFVFLKSSLRYIFSIPYKPQVEAGIFNGKAILHDHVELFAVNNEHIINITKLEPGSHFFKSLPPFKFSVAFKLYLLFTLIILLPMIILKWLCYVKRRNIISLFFLYIVEWISLVKVFVDLKIKDIYYFGSFENDANCLAYLCDKFKININYMVSPNPLAPFYCRVVAGNVFFSLPYQEEEYKNYKNNWFIKSYSHVPPYGYKKLLVEVKDVEPEHKIGYLSGGSIVRRNWKGRYYDDGVYESEKEVLELLDTLDDLFYNEISIYLHPHEKSKHMDMDELKHLYSALIKRKKIIFINIDGPSYKYFFKTNVCVSVYSSSAQERLFMRYKTLLAPLYINYKYYKGLSIEKIVSYNKEDLICKIKTSLNLSNDDFFKYYNLEKYTYKNYTQYLN